MDRFKIISTKMNVQINSSVQRVQKLKGKEMWKKLCAQHEWQQQQKYDQITTQKLAMKAMLS